MVTVYVPSAAVALLLKVNVLVLLAGLGPNEVVTPLGTPTVKNLTLPVKAPVGFIAMVVAPCDDTGILTAVGDADRVKSPEVVPVTVKVTVVECVSPPPEPVTVIG
jgi:hypothetical protein